MTGFLLDTNVISELIKPHPEPKVVAWMESAGESLLFLSVLTLGEIRRGVDSLPHTAKRTALVAWLERDLPLRFSERILPVDRAVADRWGTISGAAAVRGSSIPVIDGLLAATALHYALTLVTRDTKGVAGSGVAVLNPWA